mgnify:CR=1 FL=1
MGNGPAYSRRQSPDEVEPDTGTANDSPSLLKDIEVEKTYGVQIREAIDAYVTSLESPAHKYDERGRMFIELFTLSTKNTADDGPKRDIMDHMISETNIDMEDIHPDSYVALFNYVGDDMPPVSISTESSSYYRGTNVKLSASRPNDDGDIHYRAYVLISKPGHRVSSFSSY